MLVFTDADKASEVWRKLIGYYQERLAVLRSANDRPRDHMSVVFLQGQIAECKRFLGLDQGEPAAREEFPDGRS
jgi:hypothetical protein